VSQPGWTITVVLVRSSGIPDLAVTPVVDLFNPDQGIDAAGEAFGRFPGLADAYLRLARLTAKSLDVAGSANANSSAVPSPATSNQPWKTYFSCADYLFRLRASSSGLTSRVPALDTEWADALAADYARLLKAQPGPSKAKTSKASYQSPDPNAGKATSEQSSKIEAMAARADALYQSALKVNPSWTNSLLGRGKLLLDKGQGLVKAQGSKPSQESQALFVEAIQQYALAIQFSPKSKPAYQGRAEAYLSLAGHPRLKQRFEDRSRCLSQAASSADMACQLGRDRDPVCLQLLARVFQGQGEICSVSQPPQPRNAATFYKQASYYWQEAAACPNAPDRSQLQVMASTCRKKINEQQNLITESSRGEEEPAPEPQVPFYVPGANLFGDRNR
jgi:tetratricopeptide (TPR) repeat protein